MLETRKDRPTLSPCFWTRSAGSGSRVAATLAACGKDSWEEGEPATQVERVQACVMRLAGWQGG